jgi:periplasmic protein TonB
VVATTLMASACASTPVPQGTLDISASGHPYLETVRKQIRQRWDYPCMRNASTGVCEYKTATVRIEFGIRRNGALQFADVTDSSGLAIYDARALEAVRRAAPFPPVPDDLMARTPAGSTCIPINIHFKYVVEPIK